MRPERTAHLSPLAGAAFAILALGATAHAVPNPRCAGVCADGITACGRARDCDEGPCAFPDACLPGFAALIEEVLPDAPGGVDDPFAWTCGALNCRVGDDGAVYFSGAAGIGPAAVKDLVFQPNRRVLIRAEMRADENTWGYFEVVGATVVARSSDLVGPSAWGPVMALVELPDTSLPEALQLRVHTAGDGEVGWRNAVVYLLGPYGVYLRWTLVEPSQAAEFRIDHILRQAANPPGLHPRVCGLGEAVDGSCVDPLLTHVSAESGAASDWLEVSAMFSGGTRATSGWEVVDATDGTRLEGARRVRAEVAWRPDAGAVIWSGEIEPSGGRVALTLPEGLPRPDLVAERVAWVRTSVAADLALLNPAVTRPKSARVGALMDPIDDFEDPGSVSSDAVSLLVNLGLNTATFMSAKPRDHERTAAREAGLTYELLRAEGLLSPWDEATSGRDFDLDALRLDVARNLADTFWSDAAARADGDADAILAMTGDRPLGLAFSGPQYRAAFHAWLIEGAARAGLTPEHFGVATFDEVAPLEDMAPWRVTELRPSPTEPTAARRFVWALRFWSVASARAWSAALDTWQTMSRIPWRAAPNSGSPLEGVDYQWASGMEPQTMLAHRAESALVGGGSARALDDCRPWDLAYLGDWLRGIVEPWRGGEGLDVGTVLSAERGDQGRKMIELAARGVGWFIHGNYGPHALSTGDGAGGLGAVSAPWLDRVARGSELLAAAELALQGARRAGSPIAFLGSQSDGVWTDLPAATDDELGWHMALSQAHYPIDILPESEIAAGALDGPGATRRVLFVLRKHLSQAAFEAIRRWVEAGGTLVLGPQLASHDEYGQIDPARNEWLAVAPGPTEVSETRLTVKWVTRDGLTSFGYDGPWSELVGVGGTTVAVAEEAATAQAGRPVALRVPRGRGRVFVLGLALGAAYRSPLESCAERPAALPPNYPDRFSDAMRRAMASIPETLDLDRARPVWADDARVSLQALEGPIGPVIVAVAWGDQPLDVALSSNDWRGCESVHDVIENYEVPVLFGNVLLRIERAAVLTWDRNACRATRVESGDTSDAGAEDVRGVDDDDGCRGGARPGAWWLALAAARLLGRRSKATSLRR